MSQGPANPNLNPHLSPEGQDQALGSTCWATRHRATNIGGAIALLNSGPEKLKNEKGTESALKEGRKVSCFPSLCKNWLVALFLSFVSISSLGGHLRKN